MLTKKRGLHPLAILLPFSSFSRPPRLSRSLRLPRWFVLAVLFGVILIVDFYSVHVTVQDNGDVIAQYAGFTWVHYLAVLAGIGLVIAVLIVRWWSFRWWIAADAIWTSGGIVNTWRRRVTFDHVVTIDRSSTPFGRVFGVARMAIETTAVDQAAPDVLLGHLSNKDADLLEDLLMAKLVFAGEENEAKRFEPLSVDRLGWGELILAGATTFQGGRAVVLLYAATLFVLAQTTPTVVIRFEIGSLGLPEAQFVLAPLLGIIAALWLVSTGYFVVSFARFRLGQHEGWLILETGAVRRSRRLIKTGAIQGLEISRSPLQRVFRNKRAMLRMRLPAYGAPPLYAMVLHPAVTDATLPGLTRQIVGMDRATSEAMCGKRIRRLAAKSRAAYFTYWPIRIAAGCGVLLAVLLILAPRVWWLALLPLLLAVPLALVGRLAWRGAGWSAGNGDWLLLQRGAFTHTATAARSERIQYVTWSHGLFSRGNALGSLAIAVATSGGAGLFSQILALVGRPVDPSLVRLRAVDAASAAQIALASGFARSLPPDVMSGPAPTVRARP